MNTTKTAHLSIDIGDVANHGTVEAAIAAWCEESDTTSTGVIGSSFSTSGPGPGWSMNHGVNDYAQRAMEGGAKYYIDAEDGRMKTAEWISEDDATEDDDRDMNACAFRVGEWSDESVIELVCPDIGDVLENKEAFAEMVKSLRRHHAESNVAAWKKLVAEIRELAEEVDGVDLDTIG